MDICKDAQVQDVSMWEGWIFRFSGGGGCFPVELFGIFGSKGSNTVQDPGCPQVKEIV